MTTYAESGVRYDELDAFKLMAQTAARSTGTNLQLLPHQGLREVAWSRGESVYVMASAERCYAHVEEGLGTKNLVADAVYAQTGELHYGSIAHDAVAMIVNDLITVGAMPVSLAMHLAVGNSSWFKDTQRSRDLIDGWMIACNLSGAAWGGGETPTLKDLVVPDSFVLSGSAWGIVEPRSWLIEPQIQAGDRIVLLASSGIHANGLTLVRHLATQLPDGYQTILSDGRTFGQHVLRPTRLYRNILLDCLQSGVEIHYASNLTGHGWRKLMRAVDPFVYRIETVPPVPEVFTFIQQQGEVELIDMYDTFNMGAGFALTVPEPMVPRVFNLARRCGIDAYDAGVVEKNGDEKKVIIAPLDLEYPASTLLIR